MKHLIWVDALRHWWLCKSFWINFSFLFLRRKVCLKLYTHEGIFDWVAINLGIIILLQTIVYAKYNQPLLIHSQGKFGLSQRLNNMAGSVGKNKNTILYAPKYDHKHMHCCPWRWKNVVFRHIILIIPVYTHQ